MGWAGVGDGVGQGTKFPEADDAGETKKSLTIHMKLFYHSPNKYSLSIYNMPCIVLG